MIAQLRPALVLLIVLSLVTGVAYPMALTGLAQVAFPKAANGSLVTDSSGRIMCLAAIAKRAHKPERVESARRAQPDAGLVSDGGKVVQAWRAGSQGYNASGHEIFFTGGVGQVLRVY